MLKILAKLCSIARYSSNMLKHIENDLNECEESVIMLRAYVKYKLILCYNWNTEIIPSNRKPTQCDEPDPYTLCIVN